MEDSRLTVVTAVGSSGVLGLIAGQYDPVRNNCAWRGLFTAGARDLSYGYGSFVLNRDQTLDDGLRACANRGGTVASCEVPDARAFIEESATWIGPARTCREHFAAICVSSTLTIAGQGGSTDPLLHLDSIYGREWIEPILTRMPLLVGVLATRLHASCGEAQIRLLDAIVRNPRASIQEMADNVAALFEGHLATAGLGPFDPRIDRAAWKAQLRRLLRSMEGKPANPNQAYTAMLLCGHAPRDWMPTDAEGLAGMAIVLSAAVGLARLAPGVFDVATMIAPVHGGWARAAKAFLSHAPAAAAVQEPWCHECADMATAYASQVGAPAIAYARTAFHMRRDRDAHDRARMHAMRRLFHGKGIVAIADANADWHRQAPAMNAAIEKLSGFHTSDFPRPFPDFMASNGLHVVPILSAKDLVAEGAAMAHCVGSYADGCRDGSYAVASVREADGTRISTFQVTADGRRGMAHKGVRNTHPSTAAMIAVQEFVSRPREVRPPVTLASLRPDRLLRALMSAARVAAAPTWVRDYPYDPCDPVRILRAASLWDRYVPRDARGSVRAILAGMEPELAARFGSRPDLGVVVPMRRMPLGIAKAIAAAAKMWWRAFLSAGGPVIVAAILLVCFAATAVWNIGGMGKRIQSDRARQSEAFGSRSPAPHRLQGRSDSP